MGAPLFWISDRRFADGFPPVETALDAPDGLLAVGGDLDVERLLEAYRGGIFPWYSADQPILWWSPDPRTVIYPEAVHVSRSLRRTLNSGRFNVTFDRDFDGVIEGCAGPRPDGPGTWLTREMIAAYRALARRGHAHSVECWHDGALAGGIYGVAIGRVFFGESMFSRRTNASKVCLVGLSRHLCRWGYRLLDCQVHSPHLESLGAIRIARKEFVKMLNQWCTARPAPDAWLARVP